MPAGKPAWQARKPALRWELVRFFEKSTAVYVSLLAGAFAVAVIGGYFSLPLDHDAYDEMFRRYRPPAWQPESVLLVIDEATLDGINGGMSGIRGPLARGLRLVAEAKPKAGAVDIILANPTNAADDQALADALAACPNLVLSSELIPEHGWEDPLPMFRKAAAAVGHVHV